jgi:hypothetical protein
MPLSRESPSASRRVWCLGTRPLLALPRAALGCFTSFLRCNTLYCVKRLLFALRRLCCFCCVKKPREDQPAVSRQAQVLEEMLASVNDSSDEFRTDLPTQILASAE